MLGGASNLLSKATSVWKKLSKFRCSVLLLNLMLPATYNRHRQTGLLFNARDVLVFLSLWCVVGVFASLWLLCE